jgi:hypothetical protein
MVKAAREGEKSVRIKRRENRKASKGENRIGALEGT